MPCDKLRAMIAPGILRASQRVRPVRCALIALGLLAFPIALSAATSGTTPDRHRPSGFRSAEPGYQYRFPQDHGTHDNFRTEWWYYTGHLTAENGRRFGYQITFFRRGI